MTRFKQMVSLIAVALLVAAGSSNASDIKFELKRNDVPRIIGGTALTSGERPWMVSLQEYGQHFCGGHRHLALTPSPVNHRPGAGASRSDLQGPDRGSPVPG